ncbi:hypothetical protein PRIPAC_75045 [Pristionchus pacificus]|uniref:Uncharacterized protein n=1 Tax=Pristionchus pacificus TaxID=54126 RepID=A0A2A6CGR8_PRIPA|nr:hypothetical protein PRIPAC_75045 [Pristionchus pacificus]|eukprot:PDM77287.1 hypothetical protein PRIPAC_43199 [Pristionchus pacificus]
MAAAVCKCFPPVRPPPQLLRLRPPPDPSLVWHLLSDEPFQKAPDCAWSPLLGPGGVPSSSLVLSPPTLILALALLFCGVLALAVVCAFCILVKRRGVRKGSEAVSTEAIVTSGDHLWSYNSMKSHHNTHLNPMVGSMYGSSGMVHGVATPASLRHYNNNVQHVQQMAPPMLRHAQSAHFVRQGTLRIVPGSPPGAVAVDPSSFHTMGRHYEEIGDPSAHYAYGSGVPQGNVAYPLHHAHQGGGLPYVVNCGPGGGGISYTLGAGAPSGQQMRRDNITPSSRHSVRRPPPACRPPPPPQEMEESQCSPRSTASTSSSSSFDHELSTVMGGRGVAGAPEDPQPRREYLGPTTLAASGHPPSSNEGDSSPPIMGRESGYGTAPSRQWRTPPGSAGKGVDDDATSPPLHAAPSIQHSMTYV